LATVGRDHSQTLVRKAERGSPGKHLPRKQRLTDTAVYARIGSEAAARLRMGKLTDKTRANLASQRGLVVLCLGDNAHQMGKCD